ncbi:unnamed protein product [Bemisia tabaci]|uniref:CUB domain-containing protein n=1 Tax=Bemisia tabaci TaxID=7038 RepID=A0A9P0F1C5_BEMTA|nr:unnamed protein product [Bemisia tabaci]
MPIVNVATSFKNQEQKCLGGQVLQSTKTPPLFTAIRGRRDEPNSGEDVGACRQFVEGDPEKMEFYSPNYPSNYPNHSDCIAVLTGK